MRAVAEKLFDSQDDQDKQFGIKTESTRGEAETGLEIFASSSPTKRKSKLASPLFGRDKAKRLRVDDMDQTESPSPLTPIEVSSNVPSSVTGDQSVVLLGAKPSATESKAKRSCSITRRKVLSLRTRISAVLRKTGGATIQDR
jgi:hypothetical protein